MGRNLCWEAVVYDSNVHSSNGTPLLFDAASPARVAPRLSFGQGCFARRQSRSFWGDMELVHAGGTQNHFLLQGEVQQGPMAGSGAIPLVAIRKLAVPFLVGSPLCHLRLDPTTMIPLAPVVLDHLGGYRWSGTNPMGRLPDGPTLAGATLYGQYAAVSSDWMDPNIYTTNGTELQTPLYWTPKGGPDLTTISATGTTASTGTVRKNYGLVIAVGP